MLKAIPAFLFNLQGIGWLQDYFSLPSIGDIGILWFFTVIFLCYLLLPFINKYACKIEKHGWILILVVTAALNYIGIHLGYILTFFIGYMMQKKKIRIKSNKQCAIWILAAILCQGGRLAFRLLFDNTIFYKYIIAYFTHLVLAESIFLVIDYIVTFMTETKELRGLIQNKIIKYLDSLSIYVYIVHYSFLRGVFAVDKMMNVYVIWIPLFFGITIVSAMLLEKICSKVIGRIQTCS